MTELFGIAAVVVGTAGAMLIVHRADKRLLTAKHLSLHLNNLSNCLPKDSQFYRHVAHTENLLQLHLKEGRISKHDLRKFSYITEQYGNEVAKILDKQ